MARNMDSVVVATLAVSLVVVYPSGAALTRLGRYVRGIPATCHIMRQRLRSGRARSKVIRRLTTPSRFRALVRFSTGSWNLGDAAGAARGAGRSGSISSFSACQGD